MKRLMMIVMMAVMTTGLFAVSARETIAENVENEVVDSRIKRRQLLYMPCRLAKNNRVRKSFDRKYITVDFQIGDSPSKGRTILIIDGREKELYRDYITGKKKADVFDEATAALYRAQIAFDAIDGKSYDASLNDCVNDWFMKKWHFCIDSLRDECEVTHNKLIVLVY